MSYSISSFMPAPLREIEWHYSKTRDPRTKEKESEWRALAIIHSAANVAIACASIFIYNKTPEKLMKPLMKHVVILMSLLSVSNFVKYSRSQKYYIWIPIPAFYAGYSLIIAGISKIATAYFSSSPRDLVIGLGLTIAGTFVSRQYGHLYIEIDEKNKPPLIFKIDRFIQDKAKLLAPYLVDLIGKNQQ